MIRMLIINYFPSTPSCTQNFILIYLDKTV